MHELISLIKNMNEQLSEINTKLEKLEHNEETIKKQLAAIGDSMTHQLEKLDEIKTSADEISDSGTYSLGDVCDAISDLESD